MTEVSHHVIARDPAMSACGEPLRAAVAQLSVDSYTDCPKCLDIVQAAPYEVGQKVFVEVVYDGENSLGEPVVKLPSDFGYKHLQPLADSRPAGWRMDGDGNAEGQVPATSGDPVDHPTHYNSHPSGVECIDVIEWFTHNIGAAVKYLWRNGLKDGNPVLQELAKARWYIDREIQRLGGEADRHGEPELIDLVFDAPPGAVTGRFIESERQDGSSLKVGEWVTRGDGTWALRLNVVVPS